jgi:hypothetical protein
MRQVFNHMASKIDNIQGVLKLIPSSELSRGYPVDQVKMFKKKSCHFEKNIKVANIYSKVSD